MSDDSVMKSAGKLHLLPCAHCGGDAGVRSGSRQTTGHGETTFVARLGCSCGVGVTVSGRDDAEILTSIVDGIAAWNTRQPS